MQKINKQTIGHSENGRREMIQYANLQLAALGQPLFRDNKDDTTSFASEKFMELTGDLINSFREKSRLLSNHLCPSDARIQAFIDRYLSDIQIDKPIHIPSNTFYIETILDWPAKLVYPPTEIRIKVRWLILIGLSKAF
jgi:hypothetical protein